MINDDLNVIQASDDEYAEDPAVYTVVPEYKIARDLKRKLKMFPYVPMIIEVATPYKNKLIRMERGQSIKDRLFNVIAQISPSIDIARLGTSFIPAIGSLDWVEGLIDEFPITYVSENRRLFTMRYFAAADDVITRQPSEKFLNRDDLITSAVVKKAIGCDVAAKTGIDGKGNKIAVGDTGAGRNRQYNLSNIQAETSNRLSIAIRDASGHGVLVSTLAMGKRVQLSNEIVIEGMAPGSDLFSGKCLFTAAGIGTDYSFIQILVMALNNGANIFNGSLGSESVTDKNSASYKTLYELNLHGVVLVFAAGNSGVDAKPDSINSPGDVDFLVTVGSKSIKDDSRSFFSSIGGTVRKPEVAAYGGGRANEDAEPDENILSSSTGAIAKVNGGYRLGAVKGTSQATPIVAGTIANWNQVYFNKFGRYLNNAQVKKIISENGHSWNKYEGHGTIQYDWIFNYIR